MSISVCCFRVCFASWHIDPAAIETPSLHILRIRRWRSRERLVGRYRVYQSRIDSLVGISFDKSLLLSPMFGRGRRQPLTRCIADDVAAFGRNLHGHGLLCSRSWRSVYWTWIIIITHRFPAALAARLLWFSSRRSGYRRLVASFGVASWLIAITGILLLMTGFLFLKRSRLEQGPLLMNIVFFNSLPQANSIPLWPRLIDASIVLR